MNDRLFPARPSPRAQVDIALPAGARLGPFEVQRLLARGASSFVYLATDHALAMPVALQEYLSMHMVYRDAWLHLHANDAWHEDVLSRGMRIFIDESRLLARCEHPALVRVNHLFEANGTAYRVMPFHPGKRLSEVRAAMTERPAESALRVLVEPLLGALETIHRFDQVHGGVSAENILLIDDDFPLLLSPGAAARELRSDLVESLMATVESQPGALLPETEPTGAALDLRALAEVMRFCITGDAAPALRPREPLASLIARESGSGADAWPVYSPEFIGTLDAATSPSPEDWPNSVAQFRLWLAHGTPAARASASRRTLVAAAPPASTVSAAPAFERLGPPHPDLVDPDQLPEHGAEPFFAPIEPIGTFVDAASNEPIAPASSPRIRAAAATARPWRGLPLKLLFGAVLAGLAGALIAWVSGAWSVSPVISLEPHAAAPALAQLAPAGGAKAEAPSAERAAPQPAPNPVESAPATAPPAADRPASVDEAERLIKAEPPSAGPAPKRRSAATPDTRGRVAADPRSRCGGRTEFALYRCMQQQCASSQWSAHPQCIRLRRDDRVD